MQEYIKKEDVTRMLFRIIESKSLVSDIRGIIKTISVEELEEYKKGFVDYNFPSVKESERK